MSYYYLLSQLPYLVYGQPAPMTSQGFKDLCAELLDRGDAPFMDLCSLDPEPVLDPELKTSKPTGSRFLNAWLNWEGTLRLHLARFRAQRLKWETSTLPEPPENPMDIGAVARAAVLIDSPLEAEFFLDQARWNAIEALQGLEYFSANTVYAYLLRLLLMERRTLFKVEEGFTEYKGLYTAILAAASTASGEPK